MVLVSRDIHGSKEQFLVIELFCKSPNSMKRIFP